MFKVIFRKRGRIIVNINFRTLPAAIRAARTGQDLGFEVEMIDFETTRLEHNLCKTNCQI